MEEDPKSVNNDAILPPIEDPQPVSNAAILPPKNNVVRPISSKLPDIRQRENPFLIKKHDRLTRNRNFALTANRSSPFTQIRPLRPNILDEAANERERELAEIRKKSGFKWKPVAVR
jgi:hypothetical protein